MTHYTLPVNAAAPRVWLLALLYGLDPALLPRTEHLGLWAPALNALLFAMLHMIVPWSWPVFFLMTLPWSYLVWWRRSVKIGLFIHVGMLGLQWFGMTLVILGVVQPPV